VIERTPFEGVIAGNPVGVPTQKLVKLCHDAVLVSESGPSAWASNRSSISAVDADRNGIWARSRCAR